MPQSAKYLLNHLIVRLCQTSESDLSDEDI